jgi:hypothetical protein
MNPRLALVTAVALGALSACVVVPIDPRTGQPYPLPPAGDGPQRSTTTVVMPPAPSAPSPSVLTARLYPLNEQANQGGLLTAVIVDGHGGRGTITLGYRGDTLQGEATRVDGGPRGIANAYGPRGVNAQCEYRLTAHAQGTGTCLFSDGAKYQLHFGG